MTVWNRFLQSRSGFEVAGGDLVWCLAIKHALSARVAGCVENAGVKQLPLSVSTWVSGKGKAAAASRKNAMALFSVSQVNRRTALVCG